ncbi:MAG: GNAT family N-acetyltransferase [Oscillospiraceae bacterium]|nr:GNAT family N-acetyltransferase [Oscillospiraceae bacterium]
MVYPEKTVTLKDGRSAVLASPCADDAADMLSFIIQASGETEFLLMYPEEWEDFTIDREEAFLRGAYDDPDRMMICINIDGRIAGNCLISFNSSIKTGHRASVAIAILESYWGLGIGTLMFGEMIRTARERGVRQIELDYIEGNTRARALYEKMGFRITGVKPDAIRMKDGRYVNEYMMVKML